MTHFCLPNSYKTSLNSRLKAQVLLCLQQITTKNNNSFDFILIILKKSVFIIMTRIINVLY